jgi:S1-C subfamily serine protease
MLQFGRRELFGRRDLEGKQRQAAAAVKRRRCRCRAATDADADAATTTTTTDADAPSTSRRSALLLGAATLAAATTILPTPSAKASLLVLDDDSAAERAYAAASPAVVGLAAERRAGDPLVPLGSGTVWAIVDAEDDAEKEYKDLYIIATYRQVAGVARSDARESGGLPSVRVFVGGDAGEGGGSNNNSDDSIGPYAASVLGLDPTRDLAVLRAQVPSSCPAKPLPLAVADPKRGQAVFLLGRAPSTTATATALASGVVSAVNRSAPAPSGQRLYGAVQVDAKIGVSNVGGPLVDSTGALVGVAVCPTFSVSGAAGSSVQPSAGAGISFALPARVLLEAVPNLAVYGTASGRV